MSTKKAQKKRKDIEIGFIEEQYGVDFGVRPDMKLSTYLKLKGYVSLSKALRDVEGATTRKQ